MGVILLAWAHMPGIPCCVFAGGLVSSVARCLSKGQGPLGRYYLFLSTPANECIDLIFVPIL